MNCILLLGAGFSRNWKGRLASEVRSELQTRLHDDPYLQRLLQRNDFETVVAKVQADFGRTPNPETTARLHRVQDAVKAVFHSMNDMFVRRPSMEFGNDAEFMIQKYLVRFDAIFTLNQDLLVEFHYLNNNPAVWMGSKFYPHGWYIPGVREARAPDAMILADKLRSKWHPTGDHTLRPDAQPYFKMHGSSNWETEGAEALLVIGAHKEAMINRHPVLQWYREEFRRYLSMPDTRLVVIGYSFSDEHINKMILEAAERGPLKMFVVHPNGRGILVKQGAAMIPPPEPLRDDIPSLGESTRPLSSTFRDDELERNLLYRVFEP
jgi:SIR2-like domain